MQLLTYSFFIITALFYIGLGLFTSVKPTEGGDSSLGYGVGLVFLSLGFALSNLAVTILIRSKGGFDWVAGKGFPQ